MDSGNAVHPQPRKWIVSHTESPKMSAWSLRFRDRALESGFLDHIRREEHTRHVRGIGLLGAMFLLVFAAVPNVRNGEVHGELMILLLGILFILVFGLFEFSKSPKLLSFRRFTEHIAACALTGVNVLILYLGRIALTIRDTYNRPTDYEELIANETSLDAKWGQTNDTARSFSTVLRSSFLDEFRTTRLFNVGLHSVNKFACPAISFNDSCWQSSSAEQCALSALSCSIDCDKVWDLKFTLMQSLLVWIALMFLLLWVNVRHVFVAAIIITTLVVYVVLFETGSNVPYFIIFGILFYSRSRNWEKDKRTIFVLLQQKDNIISFQATDINRKQKVNDHLKSKLQASTELVRAIMETGGAVLSSYEISYKDIHKGIKVGEGSFGEVYKGSYKSKPVAIKTMRVGKINEAELKKFKNSSTWEGRRYGLALGIAKCLIYLHHDLTEILIHRDIKPGNILVGESVVAKVADFGESRRFDSQRALQEADANGADALTMTMVGTRLYCAPEIMRGERYNESVDTFSFALVLLCLAVGNINFIVESAAQQSHENSFPITFTAGWRPRIPETLMRERPVLVALIESMWQRNFRLRPTMRSVGSTLADLAPVGREGDAAEVARSQSSGPFLLKEADIQSAQNRHRRSSKTHALFLSHHKGACATEARFVKLHYEALLEVECFLDSDNLRDLRQIVEHVKNSDVLVLLLSKEVLHRPWCLIELSTAIDHNIPIVAVNCHGKGYSFEESTDFMLHLESNLGSVNPSACEVLKTNKVDPRKLAHKLWSILPNIIALTLDTSASENAIKATIADLVDAVANAVPLPINEAFEEWIQMRVRKDRRALEDALSEQGTIRGTQRGRMLQKLKRAEEMAAELQRERDLVSSLIAKHDTIVASLMAKIERQDAKIVQLEEKAGLH